MRSYNRDEWIKQREAVLTDIFKRQGKKLAGCAGCPLEKRPFVPFQGRIMSAPIIMLGEGPGGQEPEAGYPFAGKAGDRLNGMMAQAGLDRQAMIDSGQLAIWNSFQCAPPTGETLDPVTMTQVIKQCREVCVTPILTSQKRKVPIKLVVTLGNAALQSLTNQRGIMRLRGTTMKSAWLPDVPVVPTIHPAAVLRDPSLSKLVVPDFGYAFNDVAINGFSEKKITTASLLVLSRKDLQEAEQELSKATLLSIDFETSGLGWNANACIVGMSATRERSWVFPFRWYVDDATIQHPGKLWSDLVAFVRQHNDEIVQTVGRIILSAKAVSIHNAKHDLKYTFKNLKLSWWRLSKRLLDTLVMQALIDENLSKKLDDLTPVWTTMGRYKQRIAEYVKKHIDVRIDPVTKQRRINYANIPPEELVPYCAADADAGRRICLKQVKALQDEHLWPYYLKYRKRLIPTLLEMEHTGLAVDRPLLEAFIAGSKAKLAEIQSYFKTISKDSGFSVRSNPQLQVLFKRLGLQSTFLTKTGLLSLDKEALQAMKHEAADRLLEFRYYDKLDGTYGTGMKRFLTKDGLIHPELSVGFTVSGRLSGSNPNMQNLPRDDKWVTYTDPKGQSVRITPRMLFVPPKGFVLGVADYSQIELRAAAVISGDSLMLRLFREDRDIHLAAAAMILRKQEIQEGSDAHIQWMREHVRRCRRMPALSKATEDQWRRVLEEEQKVWARHIVLKTERSMFKSVVFGKLFGASNWKLAQMTKQSEDYIDAVFNKYWAKFSMLKEYLDRVPDLIRDQERLVGVYGLIRHFPGGEIEKAAEGHQERQGINFGPQNAAAEITNESCILIQEQFMRDRMRSRVVLAVHDSIETQIAVEEIKAAHRIIVRTMTRRIPEMNHYRFPVGVGYGKSIYHAELKQKKLGTFDQEPCARCPNHPDGMEVAA